MVPRDVDDWDPDATYYRLLPEGVFEDYDGAPARGPAASPLRIH
jgi:hypothetical protein